MNNHHGCTSNHAKYQQLGAPALVYYQKSEYDIDSISEGLPSSIDKAYQRVCRAKFQFNIPLHDESESLCDDDQGNNDSGDAGSDNDSFGSLTLISLRRKGRKDKKPDTYDHVLDDESDYRKRRVNRPLHQQRLGLLPNDLENNHQVDLLRIRRKENLSSTAEILLEDYTTYDYPYIPGIIKGGKSESPQILRDRFQNSKRFAMDRQWSDPAYLAPFGLSFNAMEEFRKEASEATMLKDTTIVNSGQGNCLIVSICPCMPCNSKSRSERSWCLIHPKGDCNDRLCVSNLIAPNGAENAGHMFRGDSISDQKDFRTLTRYASNNYPNELRLGDTILEVKQAGLWDASNRTGVFVARTVTSICVLHITSMKATKSNAGLAKTTYDFDVDVCWGNYVIEEKHRIDMHTLHKSSLSLYPTSLSCHPEYGNQLIGSKFAFSSQSSRGHKNIVHHCLAGDDDKLHSTRHTIASLKYISLIDFSSSHPMVLWSAASSYVRPALSADAQFRQPQLAMGSSLFAVDLRDDSATFQWSPSAQEMTIEGFHSINSIATDWKRECILFVSSKSAGKMWEIDTRMPCRSINEWSISYSTEDASLMRQQKGFYQDGASLMASVIDKPGRDHYTSPCLTIDTSPGTHGIHVLQRPMSRATFQTDSLESVNSPEFQFSGNSTIAHSSIFALPEISSSTHPTGIAALRLPMTSFSTGDLDETTEETNNVLYALVQTSTGDIYGYALEEAIEGRLISKPFVNAPIGTNAIRVPNELEGKLKTLEHKHWKPTGGMNIRLYLTNTFPVKPNFLFSESKDESSYVVVRKIARKRYQKRKKKRFKKHQDRLLRRVKKAIRVDDKSEVRTYEFKLDKSGVTISSASQVGADSSLLIPNALKAKAKKELKFYKETETATGTAGEPNKQPTSDLSLELLEQAKSLWGDNN